MGNSTIPYLATLAAAFLLSAVLVRSSIAIASRVGAYDVPDSPRKLQQAPVPRLGGVAVALGFLALMLGSYAFLDGRNEFLTVIGIGVPALALALLGLLDDLYRLAPSLRLIVQLGIAIIAVALGTITSITSSPLLDACISVLWIMAIVNGVNLLDNSDGLAALTVLVASLGALVVAAVSGQVIVGLLAVAMVGLCAGFLLFNWHPARVYMGDAGAYFLGFLLAVLTIRLRPAGVVFPFSFLIPILLAALPLIDTSFVVMRRLKARTHPFTPGRDHLSHELQNRGLSVPKSVLVLQLGPALAAMLVIVLSVQGAS